MAICTFFGHSDCPDEIFATVKDKITELFLNNNVTEFLVGNQGNFDSIVLRALKEIKESYPQIKYTVVLAYYPKENIPDSVFPEGLEVVPKKFCIDKRNRLMLHSSDYVITYIRRNIGGAIKYTELAEKSNKTVIRL